MGAHFSGEPGVRGEISLATNTHSDIIGVGLGMLASAMEVLQASLTHETHEESSRVYVLLKGDYIHINRSQGITFSDVILSEKNNTFHAHLRLLSTVNSLVLSKGRALTE